MGAAAVLSALSHSREAAGWYARAMQLADLVATEDHALQLYTLLHRYSVRRAAVFLPTLVSFILLTGAMNVLHVVTPVCSPHMHREDLKALLLGINAAALALLAIDPEMSIS